MSLSLEEDRISQMQKEVEQLRTFTSSRENSSDCLSSMVSEAKVRSIDDDAYIYTYMPCTDTYMLAGC